MLRDCPVTSYEVMYGGSKLDLAYWNCLHWQVPKGSLADEQRVSDSISDQSQS